MWLCAGTVNAQEQIAVIVSSRTPPVTVDITTLRGIYLKKIFIDKQGNSLIPVNLPPDNPLRHAFSHAAIHMSDTQLRNYWNQRYFQGVSPPYVLGSQDAMVQFVANTPGAIGYIKPCYLDESVRQILFLPMPAEMAHDTATQCPPHPAP